MERLVNKIVQCRYDNFDIRRVLAHADVKASQVAAPPGRPTFFECFPQSIRVGVTLAIQAHQAASGFGLTVNCSYRE